MTTTASVACIVFSGRGRLLAEQVAEGLAACPASPSFSLSCAYGEDKVDLWAWARAAFRHDQVLLFIGACGIAVRAIAPLVEKKTSDPAVLVMDEAGQWVIPLLSGHIGGANRWARQVASVCQATPVITTATDVHGVWAVDEWASRHGMTVRNPQNIKAVSSAMLHGRPVLMYSDVALEGSPPSPLAMTGDRKAADIIISPYERSVAGRNAVHLIPACVSAGIGCRRGVGAGDIEAAFEKALSKAGVAPEAVASVHSIDIKKDEAGLVGFCHARGLPFYAHSAQVLASVTKSVAHSDFVEGTVGVDNVCERGSLVGGSELILEKLALNGVTVALAVQDKGYDMAMRDEICGMTAQDTSNDIEGS